MILSTTTTTSSTPTPSPASPSPSPTEQSYNFTIHESTIRYTAIGVGIGLGVSLICALIAIEIMRRKIRSLRQMLSIHEAKGVGATAPPSGLRPYHLLSSGSARSSRHSRLELGNDTEVVEMEGRPILAPSLPG